MFSQRVRSTPLKREPIARLEDLRDDCIALFINSGMTQQEVHALGGPTPATISNWLYKITKFPRLDTMRALVQAVGGDLVVVSAERAKELRTLSYGDRLNLDVTPLSRPRMPPLRKHRTSSR
jgi:hypothetical protein